jgi:hypothetical protein
MNLSRHSHAAPFLTAIAFAGALAASAAAFAQVDNPPHSSPPHTNSPTATPPPQPHENAAQTSMASTMGKHDMPGTVTSVDHKTGMVQVESEKMKLKVHFPAETIADLKKGDKITLHLGYTKG